jgi:hypothetical protein
VEFALDLNEQRFRVDLGSKKYCMGGMNQNSCNLIFNFDDPDVGSSASGNTFTFMNKNGNSVVVFRRSGQIITTIPAGSMTGTCTRVPFSGFPSIRF